MGRTYKQIAQVDRLRIADEVRKLSTDERFIGAGTDLISEHILTTLNLQCSAGGVWNVISAFGLGDPFRKIFRGGSKKPQEFDELKAQNAQLRSELDTLRSETAKFRYETNKILSEYANAICFIQNKLKMQRNAVIETMATGQKTIGFNN